MEVTGRPKKRTIVRWDDNLDELLLLTIQSVCNAQSVKIPWAEVARTMGHNTTEGAIVQHLSKLRLRRIQAKKEVPPPLKRGSNSGPAGSMEAPICRSPKRKTQVNNWDSSDEEWRETRASTRHKPGAKRKRLRSRYVETPDVDFEGDSDGSAGELVATGANFLELPNDKQQEAPHSPTPSTPPAMSKLVSYKCPKHFLAGLGKNNSNGDVSEAAPAEKLIPEQEPILKPEPVVKPEQTTPDRVLYEAFPNETFANPTIIPTGYNIPFNHTGIVHNSFPPHTTFQSSGEGTMYIPTSDPGTGLPPIGDIFSDPFTFNDSLPPLQGLQLDQIFLPDQGFQDMLGDYFIHPEESDWYNGQSEH
ncbi:hypothetical protein BDW62DRAFT_201981 [Aspergillus aurantiobrunneus]